MNRSVTLLKLEQIAAKNHLMNIINMNSINNNFLEKKRYFNIIKDILIINKIYKNIEWLNFIIPSFRSKTK